MFRDDDNPNDCFRKYGSAYDSYADHSSYLRNTQRYSGLFFIPVNDYRGWARSLKEYGYATNPKYDELLIETIERYQLYRFDDQQILASGGIVPPPTPYSAPHNATANGSSTLLEDAERSPRYTPGDVFYYNGIKTVAVNTDITPRQVARAFNVDVKRLCKYNEIDINHLIPANTKIYLQAKRNKAPLGSIIHKVRKGEKMHDIAQMYGIKLSKLYKLNNLSQGAQPREDEEIYLRSKAPRKPYTEEDEPQEPLFEEPTPATFASASNGGIAPQNNPTKGNGSNQSASSTKAQASSYHQPSPPSSANNNTTVMNSSVRSYLENSSTPDKKLPSASVSTSSQTMNTPEKTKTYTPAPLIGSSTSSSANNANSGIASTYTVKQGDTLYNISKRMNMSVEALKKLNNMSDNNIKLGQQLKVKEGMK